MIEAISVFRNNFVSLTLPCHFLNNIGHPNKDSLSNEVNIHNYIHALALPLVNFASSQDNFLLGSFTNRRK